jgi:hypothetical protein
MDSIIGSRLFTDGSTRPVYRDAEGIAACRAGTRWRSCCGGHGLVS